jgi:hypothetical protein
VSTSNENRSICARCGGACCKTQPGIDHPAPYLATADPAGTLAARLGTGTWVLSLHPWRDSTSDSWEALYYPRPATVTEQATRSILAQSDDAPCALLTADGCALPFAERPYLCQVLAPDPAFACSAPWSKRDAALAWRDQQMIVHAAVRRLGHPPLSLEPWAP